MRALAGLLLLLAGSGLAAEARAYEAWSIPAEGSCVPLPAGDDAPPVLDAVPFPFRPGEVIDEKKAEALQPFVPEELWYNRDRFFYQGMKLEIGPCYRNYSPPDFFREATGRFRGQTRLTPDGTLEGYTAGLPFAPDTIDPRDPRAAEYWAWNWTQRYTSGGSFGEGRISLLASDLQQRFHASYFRVPLAARADRPDDDYRFPSSTSAAWAAGGESKNLDTGVRCAFRQYATGERRPDIFFYAAEARRVVRGTSPDSEGPLTACLADASIGDGLFLHGGSPQLHEWKLVGVRDLLAPINASRPAYPEVDDRDFGPWGVSFASDRWELRRVLVLEGRLREGRFSDGVRRFVWYLDLQTLTPLYYAAHREDGTQGGIGYFVGRWSEDRPDYPKWPDDQTRPVRTIDNVGSALVDWNNQDSVRFETWNAVSVPRDLKKLSRQLSQSSLRGR